MHRRGFSLIELLIVVAVISIIAAVAVPSLMSSRKAANEAAAIAHLRTWSSAQELYWNLHQRYAASAEELLANGLIGNPDPQGLGYQYSINNAVGLAWEGTGDPIEDGVTGDRHFFIDNTGVIRWAVGAQANASSAPLDSGGSGN